MLVSSVCIMKEVNFLQVKFTRKEKKKIQVIQKEKYGKKRQ